MSQFSLNKGQAVVTGDKLSLNRGQVVLEQGTDCCPNGHAVVSVSQHSLNKGQAVVSVFKLSLTTASPLFRDSLSTETIVYPFFWTAETLGKQHIHWDNSLSLVQGQPVHWNYIM